MTHPSPELLACPFCGGEGLLHRVPGLGKCWSVSCKNCDAGPSSRLSEPGAIAAWNRRATPPLPADVESVVRDLNTVAFWSSPDTCRIASRAHELLRSQAAEIARKDAEMEADTEMIAHQAKTISGMIGAMHQAASWFEEYAQSHLAKGAHEKSARNQERAAFLRMAIPETVDSMVRPEEGTRP